MPRRALTGERGDDGLHRRNGVAESFVVGRALRQVSKQADEVDVGVSQKRDSEVTPIKVWITAEVTSSVSLSFGSGSVEALDP